MKGILDTHAFIWWDTNSAKLTAQVLAFIKGPGNTVLLSVASVWEMAIKVQTGKLFLKAPLATIVGQQIAKGITILPATLDHVLAIETLPAVHKDPFDRLLVAQANVESAVLLSADPIFARYPVKVLW